MSTTSEIPAAPIKTSPMMLQWEELKSSAGQAILFFRLGDFYEAFYDDAILIAKELDITLTKRQEVPMAGVPFHSSEGYIERLVSSGFHVAVAEQVEDPRMTKGLVKRKIMRIVTPGTLINSALIPEKTNNFLVCLTQTNRIFALAALDLTTSEFKVFETEDRKLLQDELLCMRPAELLVSEKFCKEHEALLAQLKTEAGSAITKKEEWHFDHQYALDLLLRHFKVHSLDGFGLKGMIPSINAAGTLLRYVQEELTLAISHIQQIQVQPPASYMALDHATVRHLELIDTLSLGKKGYSLLALLDETATPMGGRLLRQWLTHPLLSVSEILERQKAVNAFLQDPANARLLKKELSQVRDLERLIMRIETGYASARDLHALRLSLEPTLAITSLLKSFNAPLISMNLQRISDPTPLCKMIENALVEEPPLRLTDGGIFKAGYHPELDALRAMKGDSHAWLAKFQMELREKSGIKTLKVAYNRAVGYFIEVSRGQAEKLVPFAERKQTLVNTERFTTAELRTYEQRMLTSEEKMSVLETELFHALRLAIAQEAQSIREIARALAQIDCLLSLAQVAREQNYVCPLVDESDQLNIEEGRHPVLEKALIGEKFIPNDVLLNSKERRLLLITGPNMAGKSTYLRQIALIAIMAQIGSFVPVKRAHIGIIDKVFSRIGASDDLSRGQSTFMVEMTETANILHNATSRSLVLLDEIGRGTSTYDGISIAWAVAEHLLSRGPKTLFATHYWELTKLEEEKTGAVNVHVAVHESRDEIVFLRKIVKGSTDKSYGIHVARLAGLPATTLRRAQELLDSLEKEAYQKRSHDTKQLNLFDAAPVQKPDPSFIKELRELDPNTLTPLDALLKITRWKTEVDAL